LSPLNYTITPKGGIERKMKILKSRKALSPVVASIILIAVTVAVSIAVAAWMGALTFTFMKTEELKVTSVDFPASNVVQIHVTNTGVATLTVTKAYIDNVEKTIAAASGFTSSASGYDLAKGATGYLNVTFTWTSGYKYTFSLLTTGGNKYEYTTTAVP
jgi:flagellin-like protein